MPTNSDSATPTPIIRVIVHHGQWGGLEWTPALWSVIAGGIGLWIAGWVFGPIGLCGIVGVIGSIIRLRMGQLLLSLFGVVTSVVAIVTSWTMWLGIAALIAAWPA